MRKNFKFKGYDSCKFYNPECQLGASSIYSYKKKTASKKEEHDTG